MQSSSIYTKLKQIFPKELNNFSISEPNSNLVDESYALVFLISSTLPHLPIEQIHTLCRRQQKNILQKIQQIKHIDLYSQIATVCPSQKELRHMPTEEVLTKINQFTAKMALEQKLSEGSSDSQEMVDYSDLSEAMISESQDIVQPMEIHELNYESLNSFKGINNIFQDYNSHSHLPWNEMCIYDLN